MHNHSARFVLGQELAASDESALEVKECRKPHHMCTTASADTAQKRSNASIMAWHGMTMPSGRPTVDPRLCNI